MASVFVTSAKKHGVVASSGLKATRIGHIFNIQADENMDNGTIVAKGEYVAPDYYKAKNSTGFTAKIESLTANGVIIEVLNPGDGLLVLTAPTISEGATISQQAEYNFYNGKGEIMRCYELYVGDRFEVSKDCLSGSNIAKGASVSVTNRKLTVA